VKKAPIIPSEFQASELAAGLISGILHNENLDTLSTCFNRSQDFIDTLESAAEMLTSRTVYGLE
jgi:hypothetical protein